MCTECTKNMVDTLEVSEFYQKRYRNQNECCHACTRYCFYAEMYIVSDMLYCNRCYKACVRYKWSVYRMKQSIPYILKHTERKVRICTKQQTRWMLMYRIMLSVGYRKCSDCNAITSTKSSYCDDCKKLHVRDLKDYRKRRIQILIEAKYTCEICKGVYTSRNLALDHDHTNGAYRGVLCRNCNGAIGLMYDNTGMVRNLIKSFDNILPEQLPIETVEPIDEEFLETYLGTIKDDHVRELIQEKAFNLYKVKDAKSD